MEKDGFLDTNFHASAPSMITIEQVTWQKIAIIVYLDWVSDVIIWNWNMIHILITYYCHHCSKVYLRISRELISCIRTCFFSFFPQISKYKTNYPGKEYYSANMNYFLRTCCQIHCSISISGLHKKGSPFLSQKTGLACGWWAVLPVGMSSIYILVSYAACTLPFPAPTRFLLGFLPSALFRLQNILKAFLLNFPLFLPFPSNWPSLRGQRLSDLAFDYTLPAVRNLQVFRPLQIKENLKLIIR